MSLPPLDPILVAAFLRGVPDSVFFKDTDSRYLAVSDSMLEHHGLTDRSEILGKTDFELYASGRAGLSLIDEQRIIRTGEPILNQLERQEWSDGRVTWIVTTQMPLREKDGAIVGTFGVNKDVTAAKAAEAALELARQDLAGTSHLAGMAEVATGVLHNVGNVLNSLNVSATVIATVLRQSKASSLARVSELLRQQPGPLGPFLTADPKGRLVPGFLTSLARQLTEERGQLLEEIESLRSNLEHIKEIVSTQQAYATSAGIAESLPAEALMDDSLRMNASSLVRDRVAIVRDYGFVPPVLAQRGKVLQILINLIRNAQEAVNEAAPPEKRIILAIESEGDSVLLSVADNGIGIPAENLAKLFAHGFTTRAQGHGFGLRSSAQAAHDLGGSLVAHSDGPGRGARFTLTLPAGSSLVYESLASSIMF